MEIISAIEFKSHQDKYFDMVKKGIDVIIKSRDRGSFKIIPIKKDDSLMSEEEFFAKLDKSMKQIENGECRTFESYEELEKYVGTL